MKINKWSNLYDINGELIKHSPVTDFTIEETEKLVDDLAKKVEENPNNQMYKVYLNNASQWLYGLYIRYGNPHENELIEKIKAASNRDVTEEEIKDALAVVSNELTKQNDVRES